MPQSEQVCIGESAAEVIVGANRELVGPGSQCEYDRGRPRRLGLAARVRAKMRLER